MKHMGEIMLVKGQTLQRSLTSFGAWRLITFTGPLSEAGNLDILGILDYSVDLTWDLGVPC
jgi:hypothetical protein